MELVVSGSAATTSDGTNAKRKLDLAHSTPMTVLSMDSQAKVRRRGSSLCSNPSVVMKRSLSDDTINVRVFSDGSDSEHDSDDGAMSHRGAPSCPISPASTGSDSVNEATAQLHAMSPRDTIPTTVIHTSPFSPVFTSPSRAINSFPGSPLPSPFHPSPARHLVGSFPSSPRPEQLQQRLPAPASFTLGLPNRGGHGSPVAVTSGGRGSTNTKRQWPPLRKGRNPGNLSLDLSEMGPPSAAVVEGTTQRRNDQAAVCSQVTDFLFIGGAAAAKDRDNLVQVGITHIINCAANIAPAFYPDDFQYYNIKLRDHSGQDIARYFYNVFEFIEKARRCGGKVFVHCVKGISRSPTMAIAYLMWFKRISMLKALELVRQARPAVDPNTGFIFQLNEWEHLRTNGLLNLRRPVVFLIDVPDGSNGNGNGNGARAAEKPLVIGPLTSITEAKLVCPSADSSIHESCFVVSSAEYMFLWCGAHVSDVHVEAAQHAISLLQMFESVPDKYEVVTSGHESPVFWSLLDSQQPQNTSM